MGNLKDYVKTQGQEGTEKHVPGIKITECSTCGELGLTIRVGAEVFHPSTPEHYIQHIGVHGLTKDDKVVFVSRFELGGANTIPYVKTHIKKDVFKKIFVVSLCNIHGLWENSIDL